MKPMGGSPRVLLAAVNDQLGSLVQQIKSRRRLVYTIFAGLALSLVLFSAVQTPPAQAWLEVLAYGKTTRNYEKSRNTRTNLTAEWKLRLAEDHNWAGLQKMRKERADGSMWWDERAEQYFISKLEESQFPADCSQAHWIAHYDWVSGLLSSVHIFMLPLFFSMVRGHTIVPISQKKHPAFRGCGPKVADLNMQCFFNVTTCDPGEDSSRLSQILAMGKDEQQRTTWDELLMEDNGFFSPGGVTVIRTRKMPPWDTEVCVASSSFSSYVEAHNYHKLNLWYAMGRAGKVGVVTGSADRETKLKTCFDNAEEGRQRRVDLVIVSLMSSWMLNQMHSSVKHVADEIMSRYMDTSGQPLWKSPVLAIHIRQTDKAWEDPYWREHGVYRPVEDYALRMKQMEEEYGFQWSSIFLISDNGTAMESLVSVLNGTDSARPRHEKRYIMYDWIQDEHLVEKFENHNRVPKALKYDMQTHFLASLYIVQKIADHAIVTYSSNVGRFIGEIMAAKHRMAFVDCEGPLVTSLDTPWWWH